MRKFLSLLLCILLALACISCSVAPKGNSGGSGGDSGGSGGSGGDGGSGGGGDDPQPPAVYTVQRHAVPEGIEGNAVNLLRDDMFQMGINLLGINSNPYSPEFESRDIKGYFDYDGRAVFAGADAPVSGINYDDWKLRTRAWELSQWWSRSSLATDCRTNVSGDTYTFENDYKKFVVNPVTGTVTLRVNGGAEYDYKERPSGEWVHFLFEQYPTPRKMGTVSKIYAYIDFCVDEVTDRLQSGGTPNYGAGAQAAQLVWYFGLTDDDLQKYVWFGIPVFDSRNLNEQIVPGENFLLDAGTGSMIYAVDSNDIYMSNPQVGVRYRVTIPLNEAIDHACSFAVQSGEFNESSHDKLYFKSMNLGWELPGTLDAQVTFYQVGIYVV